MKFKKQYLTLAELGRVFGISEAMMARRLTNMNLRTSKGKPSFKAFSEKWVAQSQTSNDKYVWHGQRTVAALVEDGMKPVVPPPTELFMPSNLEGPFKVRTNADSPHEIVGANGEVEVWVAGDLNAQIVCRLLNVGHRLRVFQRSQSEQTPEPEPVEEPTHNVTDDFIILGAQ
jgi:hypothetical protein